jgi:hypothetical protein
MQEVDRALEEGTWAVAFTPSGKYIGQLLSIDGSEPPKKQYFIEHMTNPVRMRYAQEFHTSLMPRQVMDPATGQMQMVIGRRLEAFCISRCLNVEKTTVFITPTDYLFFEDMDSGDRHWHQNLVRDGIRNALQARAAESNIVIPDRGHQTGHA